MNRYDQCDETCTTDCGHCKGVGRPYAPKHGGGVNDTTRRHEPRHAPRCPRCTAVGASGLLCDPCAGEIATRLRDPEDELTAIHHTGHGIYHASYRSDVTR